MFILRFPGSRGTYSNAAWEDLIKRANQHVNTYFSEMIDYGNPFKEEDDSMEQSATHLKFTLDFPGVSPDRVSVKLASDRKSVSVLVDGTVQRTFIPPHIPGLKPDDLSVKMEHGRLTLTIDRGSKNATAEDEVTIPVNGKQFLQE